MKTLVIIIFFTSLLINSQTSKPFYLYKFSSLPEDFNGVGCYYAVSKADFDKKKYIYVSNLDNGIVSIDGHFKRFNEKYDTTGHVITFVSKEIAGMVTRKTLKALPYGSFQTGTISITYNKNKRTFPFYGYCGD